MHKRMYCTLNMPTMHVYCMSACEFHVVYLTCTSTCTFYILHVGSKCNLIAILRNTLTDTLTFTASSTYIYTGTLSRTYIYPRVHTPTDTASSTHILVCTGTLSSSRLIGSKWIASYSVYHGFTCEHLLPIRGLHLAVHTHIFVPLVVHTLLLVQLASLTHLLVYTLSSTYRCKKRAPLFDQGIERTTRCSKGDRQK